MDHRSHKRIFGRPSPVPLENPGWCSGKTPTHSHHTLIVLEHPCSRPMQRFPFYRWGCGGRGKLWDMPGVTSNQKRSNFGSRRERKRRGRKERGAGGGGEQNASLFFWSSGSPLTRASHVLSPGMFLGVTGASFSFCHRVLGSPTCLLVLSSSCCWEWGAEPGWLRPGLHLPASWDRLQVTRPRHPLPGGG